MINKFLVVVLIFCIQMSLVLGQNGGELKSENDNDKSFFSDSIEKVSSFFSFNKKKTDIKKPTHLIENEFLRVGVSENAGGAINYLASKTQNQNWINSFDHGRFIQLSLYGGDDGSLWPGSPEASKKWVWNPVQAGNYKGVPSRILEIRLKEDEIYVKLNPRNWAGGELLEDIIFEQIIKLDQKIVEVKYIATFLGDKDHPERSQEIPAVFLDSSLSNLIYEDVDGKEINIVPTFPNQYAQIKNNWAAYVKDGAGVGVYFPEFGQITYYHLEGKYACSYLAPITSLSIKKGFKKELTIYLTVGTVDEIKERFKAKCIRHF